MNKKKIISAVLSVGLCFGMLAGSMAAYAAGSSYNTTASLKAFANSYTVRIKASVTKSSYTASTYYESKAKQLLTYAIAGRTDQQSNGLYNVESDTSTMNNVTGATASVSIKPSSGKYYRNGSATHYVKTTADEYSQSKTVVV